MAAHSTSEAQSFPDHTSAPFSTTTSLATPSAMSTACDGVRDWEDGRQRHLTLPSTSVALLRCSRSCLGPSASACSRISSINMWRAAALLKTATCKVAPPGWASMSRRAPKSARAWSPWSRCTAAPPSRCQSCRRPPARTKQKSAVRHGAT
eukprot:scaffold5185_cov79-Phaeocystis_antarctica.AAC.1